MDGRRGADATELEGRGGGVARARHDTELHLIHARRHRALRPIQRQGGRGREEGGAPADGREGGREESASSASWERIVVEERPPLSRSSSHVALPSY